MRTNENGAYIPLLGSGFGSSDCSAGLTILTAAEVDD